MSKVKIIRCATFANFNFSNEEISQLWGYMPKGKVFVNSNSFPEIKSCFPSIVTINPYMKFQEPRGDLSNVKAFRIKAFVSFDEALHENLFKCIEFANACGVKVLLTYMRFRSKITLQEFVGDKGAELYKFTGGWYRPIQHTRDSLKGMFERLTTPGNLLVCDEKQEGCPSCNNCTRAVFGEEFVDSDIYSLNLSTSGCCIYNCPDCFSKRLLAFTKSGHAEYDKLKMNRKQKGLTSHKE